MKLINKTSYRTDDLRRLCLAGIVANGMDHRRYVVTIKYGRGLTLGCAYYGRSEFSLHVPNRQAWGDGFLHDWSPMEITQYAGAINHEITHNRGERHRTIAGGCIVTGEGTEWADGLVVRVKPVRVLEETR